MTPSSGPRAPHGRAGFSMVEMIVAVLILSTGLLALAGTTGAVTDLMVEGTRATQAGAVAESRLETIQGTLCANIASGTAVTGAYTEAWTVTTVGTYTRRVKLVITFKSKEVNKTQTFTTYMRCRTS